MAMLIAHLPAPLPGIQGLDRHRSVEGISVLAPRPVTRAQADRPSTSFSSRSACSVHRKPLDSAKTLPGSAHAPLAAKTLPGWKLQDQSSATRPLSSRPQASNPTSPTSSPPQAPLLPLAMSLASLKYYHTGYSMDQIPDLTGKVAIVTGGNSGLGFETVLQLAKKGARVFMASRSQDRAKAAIAKLQAEIGSEAAARVEVLALDLQDLKQTQQAARDFLARGLPLHILVNNAGIMACPFALTKDGIESQMGTNHVGHFAFTMGLLPALEKGAPSRVVNLSSGAHRWAPEGGLNLDKMADEAAMSPWDRYGQSKLANVLFSVGFDKRFGEKGIFTNSVHPGMVATELMRGPVATYGWIWTPVFSLLSWMMTMDVKQGALTQIYVATSPDITEKSIRAKYFVPFAHMEEPKRKEASDPVLVQKLWEWTDKILQEKTAS